LADLAIRVAPISTVARVSRFNVYITGDPEVHFFGCASGMRVVDTFTDSREREWDTPRADLGAWEGVEIDDIIVAFDETGKTTLDNFVISGAKIGNPPN